MKKLIAFTGCVLTLSLSMLWGDGRAVENWALGYLAALAFLNLCALAIVFLKRNEV